MNFGDLRLPERFWSKVQPCPMSGCWIWTGAQTHDGYGQMRDGSVMRYAHRVSFSGSGGSLPDAMQLDHLCRVRCCVNPQHLEAVSSSENTKRGLKGTLTTHCKRGHSYSDAYVWSSGDRTRRSCRECTKERERRYTREQGAA